MASPDGELRGERALAQKQLASYGVLDTPPETEFDDLTIVRPPARRQPTLQPYRADARRRWLPPCARWSAR